MNRLKNLTHVTRTTLLLFLLFGLDKVFAILRQILISRQIGFSAELDAFNVANNVPDLLFALISGGALAMAFIPVLSEVLTLEGRKAAWTLFNKIANLAFLVTGVLAIVVALIAGPLVRWEMGIAPGFGPQQQQLVVELMRFNLIATLIFSISGLVMAGLQANQHFLLPALAPLLYNVGQIFGVLVLSPEQGYRIGGITLPAAGMGVRGLVVGVILGAVLHLAIQIPGLLRYQFRWQPLLEVNSEPVRKVLRVMLPRLATMLSIQLIFLVRDNLASRLDTGAVSALTYGWMIFQVPETLIGTAIGTALLPTLAEHFARKDAEQFQGAVERATRVLVAVTLPVAVVLALGLRPLVELAFGLPPETTDLLMWATRGYLLGLTGQCLVEVAARSFYARQEARIPLFGALTNLAIYIVLGSQLYRWLGAPGISLTDAIAFTVQAVLLLTILNRRMIHPVKLGSVGWRSGLAVLVSGGLAAAILLLGSQVSPFLAAVAAMGAGALAALVFIRPELRLLTRL
jgi:putative peptidoglycan lipid II flippase